MAGKGSTPRKGVHSKKWDDCPLWKNKKKPKKPKKPKNKKKRCKICSGYFNEDEFVKHDDCDCCDWCKGCDTDARLGDN